MRFENIFLRIVNKGYESGGGGYGSNSGYGMNRAYGGGSYGGLSRTYTTRTYRSTALPQLNYHANELNYGHNLEMQSGSSSVEHVRSVCTKKPKTIMNAAVRCTLITNTCKAVCKEGYQFPTGETLLNVICDAGEWSLEKYEWSDKLSCERELFAHIFFVFFSLSIFYSNFFAVAICVPQCQNNGICIEPGRCTCADNFIGSYCENEKKLCLIKPPVPKNSKVSCTSTTCTISCAHGHQFADGSSITNMICKEGVWAPSRTEWTAIPDCQRKYIILISIHCELHRISS